jgi:hypothetical protein
MVVVVGVVVDDAVVVRVLFDDVVEIFKQVGPILNSFFLYNFRTDLPLFYQ